MKGRLHLKYLNTLLFSPKSKFKMWIISYRWLLRYSTFNVGGLVAGWEVPKLMCWDVPELMSRLTDNNATLWPHLAS